MKLLKKKTWIRLDSTRLEAIATPFDDDDDAAAAAKSAQKKDTHSLSPMLCVCESSLSCATEGRVDARHSAGIKERGEGKGNESTKRRRRRRREDDTSSSSSSFSYRGDHHKDKFSSVCSHRLLHFRKRRRRKGEKKGVPLDSAAFVFFASCHSPHPPFHSLR